MSLDPQRRSLLEDPTRAEAVALLGSLSLSELARKVVKPCFEKEGWRQLPETFASQGERLLLTTDHPGGRFVIRVWLDADVAFQESSFLLAKIRAVARREFAQTFTDDRVPLLNFLWLLSASLPEDTRALLQEGLDEDELLRGRVKLWDLDALYRRLVENGSLRNIIPLRLIHARHEAARHRDNREGVFAAHWFYRALRLYLQQGQEGRDHALESLDEGLAALSQDPWRNLHPHRVLRRAFATWRTLLRHSPELFEKPLQSLDELPWEALRAVLDRLEPGHPRLDWLLVDFESIFRQLELLAEKYVNTPSGLSTLQICRLLLRAGFPPTEPYIGERLQRALKDLEQEDGKSIDIACSLCTGTVVSCFSLARRGEEVKRAVEWLTSPEVRELRYATIDSMPSDIWKGAHALHYTASVLQGLLDSGEGEEEILEPVVDFFFRKGTQDERGFFPEWIRHAHVERSEVYRYILSVFLRYRLMGRELSTPREDMLRQAILALVRALEEECKGLLDLYLFYPMRMNLSSLVLGLFLDVGKVAELARQVTGYLRRRPETSDKRRGELWDSNVDRTVALLDSYLEYWEALFALAERGRPIAQLLPDEAPPSTGRIGIREGMQDQS
jgi:hypothetical protein